MKMKFAEQTRVEMCGLD